MDYLINKILYIIGFYIFLSLINVLFTLLAKKDLKKFEKGHENYEKFLKDNNFIRFKNNNIKEEYTKELDLCNRYLEENPFSSVATSTKLRLLYSLEKYNEALDFCKKLLSKEPDNSEVLDYAIKCYAIFKKKDMALELFEKSHENNKNTVYYYSKKGEIYLLLKEYNEAIQLLTRGIELNPKDFILYSDRAEAYKAIGDIDKYNSDMKIYKKYRDIFLKNLTKKNN